MNDVLDRALNAAQLAGATYAEARTVEARSQLIEVKNQQVSALTESASLGLGVRAIVDGAWGFAASAEVSRHDAEECARLACRVARASAAFRRGPVATPTGSSLAPTIIRS